MDMGELPLEGLRELAKCKNETLNFDLSAIDADYFEPLLRSLYAHIPSELHGLGFNLDVLDADRKDKIKPEFHKRRHPAPELEHSIFRLFKPNVIVPRLIALLSRVLHKTHSLRVLKFRALPLQFPDVDVLAQSIEQCQSLRILSLSNFLLGTRGFERLILSLKKRGVQTLKCRNCALTDHITPLVVSLIAAHRLVQKEAERKAEQEKHRSLGIVCLSVFDFRNNQLTDEFVEGIKEIVEDSPVRQFDLRGNPAISADSPPGPKFLVGEEEGPQLYTPEREAQLEDENQRLRKDLKELTQGKDVAILRPDLYAIGDRAAELVRHIEALDTLCTMMEADGVRRIEDRNRTPSTQSPRKSSK
jgi:hypothetical protein